MANGFLELEFGKNPNDEHENIRRSKISSVEKNIELGMRLDRFHETGDWMLVTEGGPYTSWTDYLERGLSIHRMTAYIYMAASRYPLYAGLQNPLDKLYYLRLITERTSDDETVEQALAMLLPQKVENESGKIERVWVPFRQLTVEQTQTAWNLIRTDEALPLYAGTPEANAALARLAELNRWKVQSKERPGDARPAESVQLSVEPQAPPPPVPPEVAALESERLARQKAAREACQGFVKAGQIKLRERAGKLLWDLRGVEDELMPALAEALAKLPRLK